MQLRLGKVLIVLGALVGAVSVTMIVLNLFGLIG